MGWVFYRADSFSSAISILHGMAGLNGVSLPILSEVKLGQYFAPHDWIVFSGLHPLAPGLSDINAAIVLTLGCAIIWLMPNVAEIAPTSYMRNRRIYASTVLGFMFGVSLLAMRRVSEFLYFQF